MARHHTKHNPAFLDIDPDPHFTPARERYSWVESSFDESGKSREQEFLGVSIGDSKIELLFIGIGFLFVLFFLRAGYLQVIEGHGFALLAERNKVRAHVIPAKRGIIYDRTGTPLVWNVPTFSVVITPADLPVSAAERATAIGSIEELLHLEKGAIATELTGKSKYQPVVVADGIDYERSLNLSVVLAALSGVSLEVSERRMYNTSSTKSLSHVLGYTGRISDKELAERADTYHLNDTIGKEGLELSYEAELHGENGRRSIEVDALGKELRVLDETRPVDGQSIVLSLDAKMQAQAEKSLRASLEKINKKKGVVIISDPRSGAIRALVSLPAYDNNTFASGVSKNAYKILLEDSSRPLFNRAVYGEYPSGSTIKPLVAAAALQEEVVTAKTVIRSTGGIHVGQWRFPDWLAGGHGMTTMTKAIAESVNTYFYMIGGGYGDMKGLGIERLAAYFRKFGLGEKTGIDLLGEREGFVPTPEWKESVKNEPWYIGDTYHVAIGQGDILVTPLQVNEYTQYFANNGTSFVPHFVQSVIDASAQSTRAIPARVYKQEVVVQKHVTTVREGMRATVTDGSARRLSTLPITSAGKTGTAQWGGPGKAPHAWFTGWAPYEKPELAITVLVEEGEEGSRSASPVAYDILKWYATSKHP